RAILEVDDAPLLAAQVVHAELAAVQAEVDAIAKAPRPQAADGQLPEAALVEPLFPPQAADLRPLDLQLFGIGPLDPAAAGTAPRVVTGKSGGVVHDRRYYVSLPPWRPSIPSIAAT